MKQHGLRPPRHLQPATRAWWREVNEGWHLEGHHRMLLTLAGTAWDRAQQARALVEEHGLASGTAAGGLKLSPFAKVEADAMVTFARLLRELDLDVAAPADAKRPPMLRSVRGADAA